MVLRTRKAVLSELALRSNQVEELIQELQRLEVDDTPAVPPSASRRKRILQTGDRVRVTVRGPYHNRTGRITSARGQMFWNVCLDKLPGDNTDTYIYKMGTSLRLLPDGGNNDL